MNPNVRPESMQRIVNFELANAFIDEQIKAIREQVGDKKVLLALSGGVDSSVVAALLIKAIGKQLVCVHVNHGLMRKNESENVVEIFRNQLDANLIYVDATDRFLDLLKDRAVSARAVKIRAVYPAYRCGACARLLGYLVIHRLLRQHLCNNNALGNVKYLLCCH